MSNNNNNNNNAPATDACKTPNSADGSECRWLRESHFQRDLQTDNIDADIVLEELQALHAERTALTRRERLVKFLRSNQVQTLLCSIVLVDACIVVAQLLLDINSVKDRLIQRDDDLAQLIGFIRGDHGQSARLRHYTGHDVNHILRLLTDQPRPSVTSSSGHPRKSRDSGIPSSSYDANVPEDTVPRKPNIDVFRRAARGLHYVSIAILSFLLLEEVVRITAMGRYICQHKIEIFDAVVIVTSFTVDVVFVGGVSGDNGQKAAARTPSPRPSRLSVLHVLSVYLTACRDQVVEGQKAAAALVVLLVWRLARVVDGIITTVKRKQEFRIRLQSRARRRVEKLLEEAEDERQRQTSEVDALRQLCLRAGVGQKAINTCSPHKSARHLPRMLQALTSVARLSFSMTFLSRPSSPLSVHLPTRHPSDGILPCYRKSSVAAAALGTAESTSTETEWSSPATRACRTDERRRRHDLQLSPPRQRSRSDAAAYCRRNDGRLDRDRLVEMLCGRRPRADHDQSNDSVVAVARQRTRHRADVD